MREGGGGGGDGGGDTTFTPPPPALLTPGNQGIAWGKQTLHYFIILRVTFFSVRNALF